MGCLNCLAAALSCASAAFAETFNPYGVCAHVSRNEFDIRQTEFALAREAGFGVIRTDFDWRNIQPASNRWAFGTFDTLVNDAATAGLQILPILAYENRIANPAYLHLDAWERYVRTTVTRYKDRIPCWEIWNEENIKSFWAKPSATNYTALLKRSYTTIKSIDPKLEVILGGLAGVPYDYIESLYQVGAAPYFDALVIHPYSQPQPPEAELEEKIAKVRAIMSTHGDASKPIWFSEIGWPTPRIPDKLRIPGLLAAGYAAAKPGRPGPRDIFALMDRHFGDTAEFQTLIRKEFPAARQIRFVTFEAAAGAIAAATPDDLVILPFSEDFPAGPAFETAYAFVKAGGVLADLGGMPLWSGLAPDEEGLYTEKTDGAPFRARLRIDTEAWWNKGKSIPKETGRLRLNPAAGKGLAIPAGTEAKRFLKPSGLKPGDCFIPLLSAAESNYTGTVAAVIRYGSDLKGAFIASGLFEIVTGNVTSEEAQAKFVPRANLIAFACGVGRVIWYEFQAPESKADDPESFFGILHRDLSPRPAYLAYKAFIAARPAGSVAVTNLPWRAQDKTLYHPQWRRPDGTAAGALWSYAASDAVTVEATFSAPGVRLTDHLGKPIRAENAASGHLRLRLTDAPLYFSGAELKAVSTIFPHSVKVKGNP